MDLKKAIAGGVCQGKLDRARAGAALIPVASVMQEREDSPRSPTGSEDGSTPHAHAQHKFPLHRRIVRQGFRLLRPLVLPFLTRLQGRVSAGVDDSRQLVELSATVLRLEKSIALLTDQVSAYQSAIEVVATRASSSADGTKRQIEKLQQLHESSPTATGQNISLIAERVAEMAEVCTQTNGLVGAIVRNRVIPSRHEVLCRTSFGWLLVDQEDLPLIVAMAETGDSFEPGTSMVMQRLIQPGDTVLDVGANVGALTLVMAAAVGRTGRVLAFEPAPRIAELLRTTVQLNNLDSFVSVIEGAVGAQAGKASLSLGITSGHNSLLPLGSEFRMVEVSVSTLDDLVPRDVTPAFVKIDVEGFELDVFRGMEQILARSPEISLVVEFGVSHLRRAGVESAEWLAAFTSRGFKAWSIDEADGTIVPLELARIEAMDSVNLLMLRVEPERLPGLVVKG